MSDAPNASWLTLTAYAEHARVNKSTISRQLGKVIPESALRRERGVVLIDRDVADRARDQQLNPLLRRGAGAHPEAAPPSHPQTTSPTAGYADGGEDAGMAPQPPADGSPSAGGQGNLLQSPAFHQGRAAKEMWSAAKTQLEVQEKRGLLLDKADVFDAFLTIAVAIRDRFENRRRMLARKIMGLTDPAEIASIMEVDDHAMLQEMAKEFEQLTGVTVAPAATPASDAA